MAITIASGQAHFHQSQRAISQLNIMLSDANTALSGFALVNNGLRFLKDRNCIIRKKKMFSKRKVKLIAGGGIGHGPAFYAFVGRGMLDGAVCGEGFGPPPVRSIVDCLRIVAKPKEGVLFIVNNYFEDRLYFGLAIERARARYGYENLKMLVNEEDYSFEGSPQKKPIEKRGLAGCIVLMKILGAMAEKGSSLNDMIEFGEGLLRNSRLGSFCATFNEIHHRLEHIEPGKGIHGEPSMGTAEYYASFNPLVQFGRRIMVKNMNLDSKTEMVLLVNNNGAVSGSAMSQLLDSLLKCFGKNHIVTRIYVGNFFSPVDPSGVLVTLVDGHYHPKLMEYLDFEVKVASSLFDGAPLPLRRRHASEAINFKGKHERQAPQPVQLSKLRFNDSNKSRFKRILGTVVAWLNHNKESLDKAGEECRVGAVGSQMATATATLLPLSAEELGFPYPAKILQTFSSILERELGGHFGLIYGLFFEAASKAFVNVDEGPKLTARLWLHALIRGNNAITEYTRYKVNDRTILRALTKAEDALRSSIHENPNQIVFTEIFADACTRSAADTIGMPRKSGPVPHGEPVPVFSHQEAGSYVLSIWARALQTGMLVDMD